MEKSDSINEIVKSIASFKFAQSKIKKDALNPYHSSKYATLSNVLQSIEDNLRENDLTFVQFPDGDCLTTMLIHVPSGEFMSASYKIHATKDNPQQWGSAITYARRYSLVSILGLNVDDDDDGEKAMNPFRNPKKLTSPIEFNQMVDRFKKGEIDVFNKAHDAKWNFTEDQITEIKKLKNGI